MRIPYFHVDAFTGSLFGGNPAGVCVLEQWLPDARLQCIAAENNLSETAFFALHVNSLLGQSPRQNGAVRSTDFSTRRGVALPIAGRACRYCGGSGDLRSWAGGGGLNKSYNVTTLQRYNGFLLTDFVTL